MERETTLEEAVYHWAGNFPMFVNGDLCVFYQDSVLTDPEGKSKFQFKAGEELRYVGFKKVGDQCVRMFESQSGLEYSYWDTYPWLDHMFYPTERFLAAKDEFKQQWLSHKEEAVAV